MSKLKTHKGTSKRFKQTSKGKILCGYAFKRHNLRKRSKSMKRDARGLHVMKECDAKIIRKSFAPYGLR